MSSPSSLSLAEEKSKTEIPESLHGDPVLHPPLMDEENVLPSRQYAKANEMKETDKPEDTFLVRWEQNDLANPRNWSGLYKSWITFVLGMLALAASLASSIIAPAEPRIAAYIGVSEEVTVLVISLYVIGFACGPVIWAPVSELFGRRVSLLPATFCLAIFSIGTAVSKNAASIFITRFLGGFFGSAAVSNVAAALGDIWSPRVRGTAVALYAVTVVGGPTVGPTIGAALTVNKHMGWRWTEYIQAIWTFVIVVMATFSMPEIYEPYLLGQKAKQLRKETGDNRYWHPHEQQKLDLKEIVTKHLARPILMLTTEPMVTCITFYASFVFALLYMTLEVFPIVYLEHRGWPTVVSTLPFMALFVGVLGALCINLANQPRYARIVERTGGKPVPEGRLAPMAVGGIIFAIGLWWFGWTAEPPVPWASSVVAAGFVGAGFNVIFQQCINFLIDTYRLYAASAVSANTLLRSFMAAGFPMFARPMFRNLGVGPAMSIIAGVATLAIPVPFVFMKYGLTLRKMSKFAPVEE